MPARTRIELRSAQGSSGPPSAPVRGPTLQRQESRIDKIGSALKNGATGFFGLNQTEQQRNRWMQRRAGYHERGSVGTGTTQRWQQEISNQQPDNLHIRDPYHRPGTAYISGDGPPPTSRSISMASSRGSVFGARTKKKESVARMAFDGFTSLLGLSGAGPGAKGRSRQPSTAFSFPRGSAASGEDDVTASQHLIPMQPTIMEREEELEELEDDVFFDSKSRSTSISALNVHALTSAAPRSPLVISEDQVDFSIPKPMRPGWAQGRVKPAPLPSTPGAAAMDFPDFGLKRMYRNVTENAATNEEKRKLGEGIVGRVFKRSLQWDVYNKKDVKSQLDEMHDHRPFFTYWISFVHIVVYIVSVSVYGIAPIGLAKSVDRIQIQNATFSTATVALEEPDNFWIGPRQADLIHLGAKFSPCMRRDSNLLELSDKLQILEQHTACCFLNDEGGCFQSLEQDCPVEFRRATWLRFNATTSGGKYLDGSVCGQDPIACGDANTDKWGPGVTDWPVCKKKITLTLDKTRINYKHMTCTLRTRPCCIGVKGECRMLTQEHCSAKKGYFNDEATLCSQVNCLGKICGMIEFSHPEHPDQVYRLWISLFLHAGVFHLILSLVFHMVIMRDMEKLLGVVRTAIIYFGSGIAGNLASAIFVPYHVEVGPAGCLFGILSTLIVEVIQSWQLVSRPYIALLKLGAFILALFILGLLPWIDNYAHIFGFIVGLLWSFGLVPYIIFGKPDRTRKIVGVILSLISVLILYVVGFIVFYVTPIISCESCKYLNCIPFTADFCENQGVAFKPEETVFEWDNFWGQRGYDFDRIY